MEEYPLVLQNLFRCRSTRRYYRTYSDAGVPVGTTGLIQILDLLDNGVPVGTTEQIRYGHNLFRYGSTHRYYKTYSETGLSDTGVPVGTTDLIQIQEYP